MKDFPDQEPLTDPQQSLLDWIAAYIDRVGLSPSIREMMRAMGLRSPAPVQSRLDHLFYKGYITRIPGKARTIRVIRASNGLPLLGEIAAGGLIESFPEAAAREFVQLTDLFTDLNMFVLRVRGDSMIGALLGDGDLAVMRPPAEPKHIRNGAIVAARVGRETTLKYFRRRTSGKIELHPANPDYSPIVVKASEVVIQGLLMGVIRTF